MDKNQARQFFANYISFRIQAKKELAEIKKNNNSQEQQKGANYAFEKHSRNLLNAQGLLNSYNINGEVNMNDFWDYSKTIEELKEIKEKFKEKSDGSNINSNDYTCGWCKQNKSGQYWYNEVAGEKGKLKPTSRVKNFYSKFCSQACLNSWNQNNQKKQNNNSEIMCQGCWTFFSGQYWYKTNPRESTTHKFCSQECCDTYWNKKQCSGSSCSNLLTSEEICYCATCSAEQEQIRKNLDKNSQDINKDLDDFQQGLNDYVENQKSNANGDKGGNPISREREREREQLQSQQSQLLSQITTLEQNPTKTPTQQADLTTKKQQLKELEEKEKELFKSLPIDTQITNLEREIEELEDKSARTQVEEALLTEKKKQLAELLKKQDGSNANVAKPKDKTGLYVGCGVIGLFALLLILILTKNRKKNKKEIICLWRKR